MNKLRFIIPTLIQINVVVAILSIVFVIIMREQQAQMSALTQESVEPVLTSPPKEKENKGEYSAKTQQNKQKTESYQQQLQGLKAELQEYKNQNKLLMQANSSTKAELTALVSSEIGQLLSQQQRIAPRKENTGNTEVVPAQEKKPITVKPVKSTTDSPITEPQSNHSVQPSQPTKKVAIASSESGSLWVQESSKPSNISSQENPHNEEKTIEANESNGEQVAIAPDNDPEEILTSASPSANIKAVSKTSDAPLKLDNKIDIAVYYANNVAYGLAIAADAGHINPNTRMYNQVQTAIALLRKGETKEEAIRKAKVPPSVMNQLMKWGEDRPVNRLMKWEEKRPALAKQE
ncbi:hypothetical protein [Gloeothece verrucosa]|uniref:Uncharacterized protein n=1 Tax=Gloeothece verrucosa (strain PCC 7822) TaxID=497965 RepID=E0UF37_GLOV7|nr:hypothetical protein [Gloeothece verrucosa]ADN14289.1 hypothetical protein Cyan7822_2311 [Gloeothece verrucosa PCC 7822]